MTDTKIVIPVYKSSLTLDEMISLRVILNIIPKSRIVFIAPSSLEPNFDSRGISIERFDESFFQGIEGYNRLMLSSEFYNRFADHAYILIYQLDCLMFRDEVESWASKGYDYIAAPWFKRFEETPSAGLWRVGNGGFSLRNVRSHLKVLQQRVVRGTIYPKQGASPWEVTDPSSEFGIYQTILFWERIKNPFAKRITVEEEIAGYPYNEDLFWSLEAPKFDPNFKIFSAEAALSFAFEMAPRWCFEANGRQLPFGCHAWTRYDRNFWEDFIPASVRHENDFGE